MDFKDGVLTLESGYKVYLPKRLNGLQYFHIQKEMAKYIEHPEMFLGIVVNQLSVYCLKITDKEGKTIDMNEAVLENFTPDEVRKLQKIFMDLWRDNKASKKK